jgi:hypothetical protein
VSAPTFVAGVEVTDGVVTRAAPVLAWCCAWRRPRTLAWLLAYAARRGWTVDELVADLAGVTARRVDGAAMSDEVARLREEIAQVRHFREEADAERDRLRAQRDDWRALAEALALQCAYTRTEGAVAVYHTGGLSVLEEAFALLGWSDPHRVTLAGPRDR